MKPQLKKYGEYLDSLDEVRQPSDNIKYSEKIKKSNGEIESVKMEMSAKVSEVVTKLAKHLNEIRSTIEKLNEEQKQVSDEIKNYCLGYFDDADLVVTKYLETVSWIFTLSARTYETKDKEEIDYKKITEKITNVIDTQFPKLKSIMEDITKEFTIVTKADPDKIKTDVALKGVKEKGVKESLNEGIISNIKDYVSNLYKKWKSSFDKKISEFDKSMAKFKAELK